MKKLRTIIVLVLLSVSCAAQNQSPVTITLVDGKQISGIVLDNYPPVYAVLETGDTEFQMIDYSDISTESAAVLKGIPPQRYGYDSMPEIGAVTYTQSYYDRLDRVNLIDGRSLTGIAEHRRHNGLMLLRWPSGEEWYIEYDQIASIDELILPGEVPFREFRHYEKGMAGVCAFALPGAGHIYNGDYLTGAAFLGGFAVAGVATIGVALSTIGDKDKTPGIAMMLGMLGIRVWDIVCAVNTASERQERRADWQKQRCGMRTAKQNISMSFGIAPLQDGAAAGIQLRF